MMCRWDRRILYLGPVFSTERTYLHKPIVSGTVDQIRSEFGKTDTIHIVFMGVDYRPNPPPLFDIEHVDTVLGGAAHDLFAVVRESATEDRVLAGKFGCLGDRVTVARSWIPRITVARFCVP